LLSQRSPGRREAKARLKASAIASIKAGIARLERIRQVAGSSVLTAIPACNE
jgi:hypothetical protein